MEEKKRGLSIVRGIKTVCNDIKTIYDKDPAARNLAEIIFLYPGFHALLAYRCAHKLTKWHIPFIPRLISQVARFFTGIEIHPRAKIGKNFFIDHGMGVVIGETTIIGDDVLIYQGVTLGGTGKQAGKRHPTVGKNCVISAGAKVLGDISIGDYAKVGAGAVVLRDVPAHATVVGVPARVVRIRGGKEGIDLYQDNSDPLRDEVCALRERMFALEELMKELKDGD